MSEGHFDPHGGGNSRPASYAVKWLDQAAPDASGSKTEPAETKRFKNRTGLGSKTEPGGRFKNRTDRKTNSKDTTKQQQERVSSAAADNSKSVQLLVAQGFDQQAAQTLARAASFDEIRQQMAWIDLRNPKNRLNKTKSNAMITLKIDTLPIKSARLLGPRYPIRIAYTIIENIREKLSLRFILSLQAF